MNETLHPCEIYCRSHNQWSYEDYHVWQKDIKKMNFNVEDKQKNYMWLLQKDYCTKNMIIDTLKYPHLFFHLGARNYLLHEFLSHQSWQINQMCYDETKVGFADIWWIPFWDMLRIEHPIVLTSIQERIVNELHSAVRYIQKQYPGLLDRDIAEHILSIHDALTPLNQSNQAFFTSGDIQVMQ